MEKKNQGEENSQKSKKYLSRIPSDKEEVEDIKFLPIKGTNSKLGLWHRPKKSHIKLLKNIANVTLIVTCQGFQENPQEIGQACAQSEVSWQHILITGANEGILKSKETKAQIIDGLKTLYKSVAESQNVVLVHCAAGIHRTGVISYTLLRNCGYTASDALDTIKELREMTFKGVGESRIIFAETYLVMNLLNQQANQNDVDQQTQQENEEEKKHDEK